MNFGCKMLSTKDSFFTAPQAKLPAGKTKLPAGKTRSNLVASVLLLMLGVPTLAQAAERRWDGDWPGSSSSGPCFGQFSSVNCWTAFDSPDSNDSAIYTNSENVNKRKVFFNGGTFTNLSATVSGSGYSWQLDGADYTLTNALTLTSGSGLAISGGGQVTASSAAITGGAFSVATNTSFFDSGNLTVNGGSISTGATGSTSGGQIDVGNILTLSGGATATSFYGLVDDFNDGSSNLIEAHSAVITGTGTTWNTNSFFAGEDGAGTVSVGSGGFLQSTADTFIGVRNGSNGTLFINPGGTVDTDGSGYIGRDTGSTGAVTVDGASARWDINNDLYIGGSSTASGGTGTLTVKNSGVVSVLGLMSIQNGGIANTTAGGEILAGNITVQSGGKLFSSSGEIERLATRAAGSAVSLGDVIVDGTDSLWDLTGNLRLIGNFNSLVELSVSNGGFVDVGGLLDILGFSTVETTGGTGGRIVAGNILLDGGATLNSRSGFVGTTSTDLGSASSIGNATVIGSDFFDSRWATDTLTVTGGRTLTVASSGVVDVSGALSIQSAGRAVTTGGGRIEAGSLLLQTGGKLFSTSGRVGGISTTAGSATSLGNALVTGPGTKWDIGGLLTVDNSQTLTVSDGGLVDIGGFLSITRAGSVNSTGGGQIAAARLQIVGDGELVSSSGRVGSISATAGSATSLGNALVTGSGAKWTISDLLTVDNSKTLTVSDGGLVDIGGFLSITRAGSVNTTGGGQIAAARLQIVGDGELVSSSGRVGSISTTAGSATSLGNALVTGSDAKWSITNGLVVDNSKTLTVIAGGLVDVGSNLDLSGGGDLVVNNATVNAGNINVADAGSTLAMTAATINANVNITNASLTGTGIINGNVSGVGAEFGPGNSPGLLAINGDFSQDINSSILFELAGVMAESEYDVLDISGTANLAGELVVDWFDNGSGLFGGSEGDVFDILFAENIMGEFDLLSLAVLGEGLGWDLSYLTDEFGSTDVLRLSVINTSAVPVPAAVWLFGSGLIGLIGLARRKKI